MLGRRSQRDFEDEIASHLEHETARLMAQGMSREAARWAARRNFGNVSVAEDRFYHAQRFSDMQDFGRDMKHAWRALRRTPGFMITCVATLALAIGAVSGMFNVVNTVMLQPLPFADPDRLVVITGNAPGTDLPQDYSPGTDYFVHYKERSTLIDGIFFFGGGTSTFRADDRVERIPMAWHSPDMYTTLGVRPALGRLPVPEDRDDVVVLSDQLWSSWFGRDPAVIGKSYFVSDSMKVVIGVMPPEFRFPNDGTMLFIPQPMPEQVTAGSGGGPTIARMKPGVTKEQLASELTRLSKELPARWGGSPAYARIIAAHSAAVYPVIDRILGPTVRASLWVLLGAVGVVLLIACANVANLFMVRAEGRHRDIAVRRAIGASRTQLVRFQMAEAFVVALVAGVLAVILSTVTLPAFISAAPDGIPRMSQVRLDGWTIGAAFVLVLIAAVACGAVPALRASSPDLMRLREGGRGSTGRRHWGRDGLVVAQTAMALVLLIGSALLVQSFSKLRNVDPGYEIANIYTFQFAPEQPNLRDGPSLGAMHNAFMDRLRALPGVTDVGVVNNLPLDEGTGASRFLSENMTIESGGARLGVNFSGGDHFRALGIDVVRGRPFTREEATTPNNSVVIDRAAAEKLWPGEDALGKTIRWIRPNIEPVPFIVVGVVDNVKQNDWREPANDGLLYFPLTGPDPRAWGMGSPAYVVKSPRAETLQREVRALVREIAPEAPVYREFTMEFLANRSMVQLSFTMLTLGVVSALALILGAIGLYGVLSYVVAERTREIGVRMALGATAGTVRRMVVSQGSRVVLIGVGIGVGIAFLSTKYMETLLFGVKAVDPVVFAAMSLAMIGVGLLASYMPARRASNVDPIESLRSD